MTYLRSIVYQLRTERGITNKKKKFLTKKQNFYSNITSIID